MKKCSVCKQKFQPFNSLQKVCGTKCAVTFAKKEKAEKEKTERRKMKQRAEALKPIGQLKSEAQTAFNRFIRLRDYHEGCISCGRSKAEVESGVSLAGGYWDAGHYKSRGAHPELRFEELNVHKQCKKCNGGSGKFSAKEKTVSKGYRENLIKKIGIEKVEWLEGKHEIPKLLPDELRKIKSKYNKKANELKKTLGL